PDCEKFHEVGGGGKVYPGCPGCADRSIDQGVQEFMLTRGGRSFTLRTAEKQVSLVAIAPCRNPFHARTSGRAVRSGVASLVRALPWRRSCCFAQAATYPRNGRPALPLTNPNARWPCSPPAWTAHASIPVYLRACPRHVSR